MSENYNSPICTLCLEPFNKPKILPCFHTYCQDCLQSLISGGSGNVSRKSFPCPSCRKSIIVPAGGVGAFQTNFYIKTAADVDEKKTAGCPLHSGKEFVAFCLTCDILICVQCVLTDHKQHEVQDIADAALRVKKRLTRDKARIQESIDSVSVSLVEEIDLQQVLKERKVDTEGDIRERHSALVTLLSKQRDLALAELRQLTADLEKDQTNSVATLQKRLEDLHELDHRVKDALGTENVPLLLAAKDIDTLCSGSLQAAAQQTTSSGVEFWNSMVYRSKEASDKLSRHLLGFLGLHLTKMIPQTVFKNVYLQPKFKCPRDEIYCVCPCQNGEVWVSFRHHNAPIYKFSAQGHLLDIRKDITGNVTLKNHTGGKVICIVPQKNRVQTYAKSNRLLILDNALNGRAAVERLDLKNSRWIPLFSIKCGSHLAFDANSRETIFAVLEHKAGYTDRSLQIFQKPGAKPVFTFTPRSFRPADLCFYSTGNRELLLVLDETNRAVHMFACRNEMLCFSGTLVNIGLFSATPSALNTDCRGNIWIGTRQGLVISCEPDDLEMPPAKTTEDQVKTMNVCLCSTAQSQTAGTTIAVTTTTASSQPAESAPSSTTTAEEPVLDNKDESNTKMSRAASRNCCGACESVIVLSKNVKQQSRGTMTESGSEGTSQKKGRKKTRSGKTDTVSGSSSHPAPLSPSSLLFPPAPLFEDSFPKSPSASALSFNVTRPSPTTTDNTPPSLFTKTPIGHPTSIQPTPVSSEDLPPSLFENRQDLPQFSLTQPMTTPWSGPFEESGQHPLTQSASVENRSAESEVRRKSSSMGKQVASQGVPAVSHSSTLRSFAGHNPWASTPALFGESPSLFHGPTHSSPAAAPHTSRASLFRDSSLSLFQESPATASARRPSSPGALSSVRPPHPPLFADDSPVSWLEEATLSSEVQKKAPLPPSSQASPTLRASPLFVELPSVDPELSLFTDSPPASVLRRPVPSNSGYLPVE